MRIVVTQVIDRPLADVFRFYAQDFVRNHPRWDPLMELEQMTQGPMGVGTIIRRRHTHSGVPVEGTMEVVEYERDRAFGVIIREGGLETRGRATFEADAPDRTRLTLTVDFPEMGGAMDATMLTRMIEGSARTIKHLIESEA